MARTRDDIIMQIAKLRAQMESEQQLGNTAAAEAFAGKVSRLMLDWAVEQAEVDAADEKRNAKVEEPIVERMVNLSALGVKHAHSRNANLERLAGTIARAHLGKILIQSRSNTVLFVGTETTTEICEYLLQTLWRAIEDMSKEAKREFKRTNPGAVLRGFASSFRYGFITRLDQRYREERQQFEQNVKAVEQAKYHAALDTAAATGQPLPEPTQSTALMAINTAVQRVQDYTARYGKSRSIGGTFHGQDRNAHGTHAGRAAADRMPLRANGINAGKAPAQLGA